MGPWGPQNVGAYSHITPTQWAGFKARTEYSILNTVSLLCKEFVKLYFIRTPTVAY